VNEQIVRFVRENLVFLLTLAALASGYLFLRTKNTELGSLNEFDALISAGRPTVAEFYSNT
jgi:hypothetical protein